MIAILMIIGAVLMVLFGFILFVLAVLAGDDPELGVLFGVLGLVILIIAIVDIILALGLLKLRPWARTWARILAALGILSGLMSVFGGDPFSIVSLVINLIVFFYLGSRNVKAAFEGSRFGVYQNPRTY